MAAFRRCDPIAAALGNACLAGLGYLMLERRRLAAGTTLVTAGLVAVMALADQPTWLPRTVSVLLTLWWAGLTAHAWYLAGGRMPRPAGRALPPAAPPYGEPVLGSVGRQRLVAAVAAAALLLGLGALRFDTGRIEGAAAASHRAGDCAQALAALDRLHAAHRVADGLLGARVLAAREACALLIRAERYARVDDRPRAADTLAHYIAHPGARWEGADARRAELLLAEAAEVLGGDALTGEARSLEEGFGYLATVLRENPGQDRQVGAVLDGFLDELPAPDACATTAVADWLRDRPAGGDALDRAAEAVPRIAPAAIVGCGDSLLADDDPHGARERYERILAEYPEHELVEEAERGIRSAETAIQLEEVRALLTGGTGGTPAYCDDPAPYRGADPYEGAGPHRAMLFGDSQSRERLPSSWLAGDAADAVLVICAGEADMGSVVTSCQYGPTAFTPTETVTFRTREVPVRVYEVRTGELVRDTSVAVGGHCPQTLNYTYYGVDTGPPSPQYARSNNADVRAAYQPLINP
ncbi:hypothetical protein [Allonocardiopsis opalescens]|nr:hypothetical protein [Allonocardiopsis opalescens]